MFYGFKTTPIKISRFLVDIDKLILKSVWKVKGPKIAKTILKRTKLEDSYYMILMLIVKLQ